MVEVNSDSTFPKEILIKGASGRLFTIGVEYLGIPLKCKNCKSFGHRVYSCPKVEKKVWLPKAQEAPKPNDTGKMKEVRWSAPVQSPKVDFQVVKSKVVARKQTEVKIPDQSKATGHSPTPEQKEVEKRNWSNSFEVLCSRKDGDLEEGEI